MRRPQPLCARAAIRAGRVEPIGAAGRAGPGSCPGWRCGTPRRRSGGHARPHPGRGGSAPSTARPEPRRRPAPSASDSRPPRSPPRRPPRQGAPCILDACRVDPPRGHHHLDMGADRPSPSIQPCPAATSIGAMKPAIARRSSCLSRRARRDRLSSGRTQGMRVLRHRAGHPRRGHGPPVGRCAIDGDAEPRAASGVSGQGLPEAGVTIRMTATPQAGRARPRPCGRRGRCCPPPLHPPQRPFRLTSP